MSSPNNEEDPVDNHHIAQPTPGRSELDLRAIAVAALELLATWEGDDAGATAPIPSAELGDGAAAELGGGAAAVLDAGDAGVAAPAELGADVAAGPGGGAVGAAPRNSPAMPAPGEGRQLRSGTVRPDLSTQRQQQPDFECARCGSTTRVRGHASDHENTHVPAGGPCLWPGCTNALAGADEDAVRAHIEREHVRAVGRRFRCHGEGFAGTRSYPRRSAAERRAVQYYHDRALSAGRLERVEIVRAAAAEAVEEEEDQDEMED